MNKKLLLSCCLLLTGCTITVKTYTPTVAEYNHIPTKYVYGTDGITSWICSDEDVNKNLVWVQCNFRNLVNGSSCVSISFVKDNQVVVQSRRFCSAPLQATQIDTNYAAFIKEQRKALQVCGDDLKLCRMVAE